MAELKLGQEPERHSECCLSLSSTLLDVLTSILSRGSGHTSNRIVLSVGSGSGLLEALLQQKWFALNASDLFIEGIEVQQSSGSTSLNKYLPEQNHSSVKGTWELSPRANEAAALMFVYPRSSDLVSRYLRECTQQAGDTKLGVVVWLGPKCDWSEFEQCFTNLNGWSTRVVPDGESGLLGYEMLAVIQRQ